MRLRMLVSKKVMSEQLFLIILQNCGFIVKCLRTLTKESRKCICFWHKIVVRNRHTQWKGGKWNGFENK